MPTSRLRPVVAALAALAILSIAGPLLAHPDDPKARDVEPPFHGPSYRSAEGGIAGLEFPAQGVTMRAWITLSEFASFSGLPQNSANDCWGYTSPSGREYAIAGLQLGTAWVEITDPGNPVIVAFHVGPDSIWRDMKVYQAHAYSVSEGGSGIQVFNMSGIDNGTVVHLGNVTTGGSNASHNVAINEDSGFLYRCGGSGNGLRIYSLANPTTPIFAASWPDRYVHDAEIVNYDGPDTDWAGREIAFCCSGLNNGGTDTGIDILDVTDKGDIVLVARYEYPAADYSHQAWLSADRNYMFLNDEGDESTYGLDSTVHVIDVSDLDNPVEVTTFTNGVSAITHNLYERDGYVFQANYSSGLRIFDASSPLAMTEVGYFDTEPDFDQVSTTNLWSCYPLFPSGSVIGTDREKGLFVWDVDVLACPEPGDADNDGTPDCDDGCPNDPDKIEPGVCGCGTPDDDYDGDLEPDCIDADDDNDGVDDDADDDPLNEFVCSDVDADGCDDCTNGSFDPADDGPDDDGDGTCNLSDGCPDDPDKVEPGVCGCGVPDIDSDKDGTLDCDDVCPDDPDDLCMNEACCLPGGICFFLLPENCAPLGGETQGPESACDPNPCTTPCPTDINEDGETDVLDLVEVILSFGICEPKQPCPADFDGDGEVDVPDLIAVILAWGLCP